MVVMEGREWIPMRWGDGVQQMLCCGGALVSKKSGIELPYQGRVEGNAEWISDSFCWCGQVKGGAEGTLC